MNNNSKKQLKIQDIIVDTKEFSNLFHFSKNKKEYNFYYKIPAFQRNYAWKEKNWNDFFRYLELATRTKRKMFWGIMIFADNNLEKTSEKKMIIVDGQQRITTFSLFMLAFYAKITELETLNKINFKTKFEETKKKITRIIYQDAQTKNFKNLNLNFFPKEDNENYENLTKSVIEKNEQISLITKTKIKSQILKAFQKIFEFLQKSINYNDSEKLLFLFDLLVNKSYFITVIKENVSDTKNENEHILKIFETLNATGKELDLLDKIKNYLLFNLAYQDYEMQEKYIDKYWKNFSSIFKDLKNNKANSLESFFIVLCCLVYEEKNNIERKYFYSIFKNYFQEFELIEKDIPYLDKYWLNLQKLICFYKLGIKNFDTNKKFLCFNKDFSALQKIIFPINQKNFFLHFGWEFMIFHFYFILLLKNKKISSLEFQKLVELVAVLETVLIVIMGKDNQSFFTKYNKIVQKLFLEEGDILPDFLLKSEVKSKKDNYNLTAEKLYEIFIKEFKLEQKISQLLSEKKHSLEIEILKSRINNDYKITKINKINTLILEFINEDLTAFNEPYDLEHIISKKQIKSKKDSKISEKNIGNLILLEKWINNNEIKAKLPEEKIEFYKKSKNIEIKKFLSQKSNFNWTEQDVLIRESKILKKFFKNIKVFLKKYQSKN